MSKANVDVDHLIHSLDVSSSLAETRSSYPVKECVCWTMDDGNSCGSVNLATMSLINKHSHSSFSKLLTVSSRFASGGEMVDGCFRATFLVLGTAAPSTPFTESPNVRTPP